MLSSREKQVENLNYHQYYPIRIEEVSTSSFSSKKKKIQLFHLKFTIITETIICFSVDVEINTAFLHIFEKNILKHRNVSANANVECYRTDLWI